VPPAILDGVRGRERCGRFALSFFDTLEAARRRYKKLAERQDAESRYGGYVVELDIAKSDGVASLPNKDTGHIDLHPNEGSTFVPRVKAYHAA
jgi:hypothetical protein